MTVMRWVLVILVAAAVSFVVARVVPSEPVLHQTAVAETPFERIMRTNTIRCGYVPYAPFVVIDPNTKTMTGVAVDLMNEIGKLLDLKIVWAEEVGWGTSIEGLKTARYDMMCSGFWRQSLEAKHVDYSLPFVYSTVDIVTRQDDARFDGDPRLIDDPAVRIVSSDGDVASAIAARDFSQAKLIQHQNLTAYTQYLEDIVTRKADVSFVDSWSLAVYQKENPGKLKKLPVPPIRIFQNTLAFLPDARLKSMIDTIMIELVENGGMDKILDGYDPERKAIMRVKKAYE